MNKTRSVGKRLERLGVFCYGVKLQTQFLGFQINVDGALRSNIVMLNSFPSQSTKGKLNSHKGQHVPMIKTVLP